MLSTFGASDGGTGFATEAIPARESEPRSSRPENCGPKRSKCKRHLLEFRIGVERCVFHYERGTFVSAEVIFAQVIFDSTSKVLASTAEFSPADIAAYTAAFNNRDATVGAGLNIAGVNYEVHRYVSYDMSFVVANNIGAHLLIRFYDDQGLIYGRIPSVDPRDGEGICLARVQDLSHMVHRSVLM